MRDYPDDAVLIEIRGVYDGWSVALLPDGRYINRWEEGDRRYTATQEWIDRMVARDAEHNHQQNAAQRAGVDHG